MVKNIKVDKHFNQLNGFEKKLLIEDIRKNLSNDGQVVITDTTVANFYSVTVKDLKKGSVKFAGIPEEKLDDFLDSVIDNQNEKRVEILIEKD